MEKELHLKEEELAEILKRQNELEMKFYQSNFNETEMKNENERLQKVRCEMKKEISKRNFFFVVIRRKFFSNNNCKKLAKISKNQKITLPNYKIKRNKINVIEQSKKNIFFRFDIDEARVEQISVL